MTDKLYEFPQKISKEEAIKAFETGDEEKTLDAILGIIHGVSDHEWVIFQLLKHISHSNKWVAGAAVSGLGDVARIHKSIDKKVVLPALEKLKAREDIAGKIEDAIDDIEMFV